MSWGGRPSIDGKFFRVDGRRFWVRGVTYGTFDDSGFGELEQVKSDFAAMADAGINTVRTYTVPPPEVLDLGAELGLHMLVGVWWDDPRYLAPPTAGAWRQLTVEARAAVRNAVRACAGHPAVLGFLVGNEIPGPVVRWHGRRRVERLLHDLCEAGKDADEEALLGYANYPTTGYLDTSSFDFDAVNVFLEDEAALRRYLAQLQIDAADRPLVLSEVGLDEASHGPQAQAEVLDWQLRAALEGGAAGTCVFAWTDEWWVAGQRVEPWRFGLVTAERDPKPALEAVARRYGAGLLGTRDRWPPVTVVVCAYQEEATIDACLDSLGRLDYPDYEVLVVDDGSTDATAQIASRHPVRLLSDGRQGLCGARNLGLAHATGEIVAYLDADATADPDWLTFLVIGLDPSDAAAVGGPNRCPPTDPPVAQAIARAPGGPTHVLLDNTRAEHVPGCNMAFRSEELAAIGGFDPIYRAAGDDVDVCWKLLDAGHTVRFHPAALVWHHPRQRVAAFWRQQVGYGRAEALVARNHPDKFNQLGQARWRGVVYGPAALLPGRDHIYAGRYGEAPFQRLYRGHAPLPLFTVLAVLAVLVVVAALDRHLLPVPLAALAVLTGGWIAHGVAIARRDGLRPAWRLGIIIGLLHLAQPAARSWGRLRGRGLAFPPASLPGRFPPLRRVGRALFAADGVDVAERVAFLTAIRDRLRANRLRAVAATPWEEADLVCDAMLGRRVELRGYVAYGTAYVRLHSKFRPALTLGTAGALTVLAVTWSPAGAAGAAVVLAAVAALAIRRFDGRIRRALVDPTPAGRATASNEPLAQNLTASAPGHERCEVGRRGKRQRRGAVERTQRARPAARVWGRSPHRDT